MSHTWMSAHCHTLPLDVVGTQVNIIYDYNQVPYKEPTYNKPAYKELLWPIV